MQEEVGIIRSWSSACSPVPPVGSLGGGVSLSLVGQHLPQGRQAVRDGKARAAFREWQSAHQASSCLSLRWLGDQRHCRPVEPIPWLSTRFSLKLQKSSLDSQKHNQKGR